MKNLTNNQYYKGLNNRFDNRVKKLFKSGFSYDTEKGFFIKYGITSFYISNTFLMHSSKFSFNLEFKRATEFKFNNLKYNNFKN